MFRSQADAAMIQEQWLGDPGTEENPCEYGLGFRQPLPKPAAWVRAVEPVATAKKSGSSTDPGPRIIPPRPPRDAWIRDRPRLVMPRQPEGRPPAHLLPPPPPPKPPNFVCEVPPPPCPRVPPPRMPRPPKYPPPPPAPEHFEVVKEEESVIDYGRDDFVPDWENAD